MVDAAKTLPPPSRTSQEEVRGTARRLRKKLTELKEKASKATGDEKASSTRRPGGRVLMTQAKDQMAKIGDVAGDKWDEWKKDVRGADGETQEGVRVSHLGSFRDASQKRSQ